ncbi:MAG: DUF418 domain-containing protein [Planctomycetota bacterium]
MSADSPQLDPTSSLMLGGAAGEAAPVAPEERIFAVDVLRGFALLGILLVNMMGFSLPQQVWALREPWWSSGPDRAAVWLTNAFASGKFYALFSLLFGLGLYLQMQRLEARGRRFVGLYARRLLVLLGFGVAHIVLLWYGDILTLYALLGWVLLALRKRSNALVLGLAAAVYLLPLLYIGGQAVQALYLTGTTGSAATEGSAAVVDANATPADAEDQFDDGRDEAWAAMEQEQAEYELAEQSAAREQQHATMVQEIRRIIDVYRDGTFGEVVRQRLADERYSLYSVALMAPVVLAMFLAGLYVGRRGILHDPAAHRRLLLVLAYIGLPLGLAVNMGYATFFNWAQAQGWLWNLQVPTQACYQLGMPLLTGGYAAALVLLAQRAAWQQRLAPLAAVGRMALTNYLLQSVVCTTVFYSYGLGWYGQVSPARGMLLALAIYAAQVPLSLWWLGRFRFGPAEWLWRTLTYWRVQPPRLPRVHRLPPPTQGLLG